MASRKKVVASGAADVADRQFKVAVITRTKDRPILLRRAAASVAGQRFADHVWVVVNDGGEPSAVEAVVHGSGVPSDRLILIHNDTSLGMEAASNIGIRACQSDYVVIHDDDDSWEPDFLEKTVGFLQGQGRQLYAGVVTHSTYVSEVIRGDQIVTLAEKPYQTRLERVDLDAVIERNLFPPISFLFRRAIWDMVGGYDESLPVLGDWLFNMEFLLRGDIGVLPEALARYHHRDSGAGTAAADQNSVVGQVALHRQYTSIVRNRFLRRNLNQSAVSLRLAMHASWADPVAAPAAVAPRTAAVAPPSFRQLARADVDLPWTIAAVNAALADRRLKFMSKYRKVEPLPPNATWSLVLPMLRRLDCTVPPPPDFDEDAYLRTYPDVAAEVTAGRLQSGFVHYLLHGRHEGRERGGGHSFGDDLPLAVDAPPPPSRVDPVFDSLQMTRLSHTAAGFDRVLHVAHHEWHGIRQATAYSPGHKLLISAHEPLSDAHKRAIADQIGKMGIDRVCFQGYSDNADALLLHLHAVLGPQVKFYMVSHVTTAQFDHQFEMTVIARLLNRLRYGFLDGIASVKPGFWRAVDGLWPGTIINYAPNMPMAKGLRSSVTEVYAPLDVGWRKNLFTNVIAGSLAANVDVVKTANFPNGLENIHDLGKLRLVGYLRGRDLFDEMARSSVTLIATLAECQPMTQLESFAVGTPALTGPLEVEEFANDPLVQLCTTTRLDNPALLAKDIERVVDVLKADPDGMLAMIAEHLDRRHAIANRCYADFLEL